MKKTLILIFTLLLMIAITACKKDVKPDNNNDNEIVFSEFVAIENENCSIKIQEINLDDPLTFIFKAEFENKSADKTYVFYTESVSINGVQCDPYFSVEVKAKEKASYSIDLLAEELVNNGIGDFTDIKITFRVYDNDDWHSDPVVYETIHIYPYGEDKAVTFIRKSQPKDNVIIDNEYAKVIVTGYDPKGVHGYTINLFLINKTNNLVMFSIEELYDNGYQIDYYYSLSVSGENSSFSYIFFPKEVLEEKSIDKVKTIEMAFKAYNINNLTSILYVNETIYLKP